VVAHYVNDVSDLQKIIISLQLIGVSHNGDNIAEHVECVLDVFCLKDKYFVVTLDNAFVNVAAIKV
jgi:hypothetical protein